MATKSLHHIKQDRKAKHTKKAENFRLLFLVNVAADICESIETLDELLNKQIIANHHDYKQLLKLKNTFVEMMMSVEKAPLTITSCSKWYDRREPIAKKLDKHNKFFLKMASVDQSSEENK
jgi:hypothetical protein